MLLCLRRKHTLHKLPGHVWAHGGIHLEECRIRSDLELSLDVGPTSKLQSPLGGQLRLITVMAHLTTLSSLREVQRPMAPSHTHDPLELVTLFNLFLGCLSSVFLGLGPDWSSLRSPADHNTIATLAPPLENLTSKESFLCGAASGQVRNLLIKT